MNRSGVIWRLVLGLVAVANALQRSTSGKQCSHTGQRTKCRTCQHTSLESKWHLCCGSLACSWYCAACCAREHGPNQALHASHRRHARRRSRLRTRATRPAQSLCMQVSNRFWGLFAPDLASHALAGLAAAIELIDLFAMLHLYQPERP